MLDNKPGKIPGTLAIGANAKDWGDFALITLVFPGLHRFLEQSSPVHSITVSFGLWLSFRLGYALGISNDDFCRCTWTSRQLLIKSSKQYQTRKTQKSVENILLSDPSWNRFAGFTAFMFPRSAGWYLGDVTSRCCNHSCNRSTMFFPSTWISFPPSVRLSFPFPSD